jgi:hypothetical protein
MHAHTRRFALRSDDPTPHGSNTHKADMVFEGLLLLQLEQVWNDDTTRGTHLDGEIFERVAIYREPGKRRFLRPRAPDRFIAEESRYNLRVIFNPHGADNPIPFFSRAKRFQSLELAAEWLLSGNVASHGALRNRLEEQLKRHATD